MPALFVRILVTDNFQKMVVSIGKLNQCFCFEIIGEQS